VRLVWIYPCQDTGKCHALVNKLINIRVLYSAGNFMTSLKLFVLQEGLCFVELVNVFVC